MTSAEIRTSFLDFFKEKQHTIVPASPLLPAPAARDTLMFVNAGMNQFIPYFLGTEKPPYNPPRATDTQKCIRAGGKHNDLEDVGYDTYHHTLFEMLGNWSFGDYFKEEAIAWAWELVVERWGLPANRLYATVYSPSEGDPSEFDQEAYDLWKGFFEKAGLDPKVHIVNGNVEDNFWKMGDTGPCGPCSELHVDMTPNGDTDGKLVNMDSDLCIEIWNLVFIQYNAEEDGSYRDLPAKHVDTGMGFERVCSLIQNTKGFTDFSEKPTNYATDVFQPIFRKLEELSGKKYHDVYPGEDHEALEEAIAFRVIADHIRTLSFSIADAILPGSNGRNYVLRRILRRGVKYGRTLGFDGKEPFLPKLVDTLVTEFGQVFPELKARTAIIKETLAAEEESFNKTLDRGLNLFRGKVCLNAVASSLHKMGLTIAASNESESEESEVTRFNVLRPEPFEEIYSGTFPEFIENDWRKLIKSPPVISGEDAFRLYDTFGFPADLTELLAREIGFEVDTPDFEARMEEARELSRASQKKTVVRATDISTEAVTEFVGFDNDTCEATILEIHGDLFITDKSVFFTEMGGQEGDHGAVETAPELLASIVSTQKIGDAIAHEFRNNHLSRNKLPSIGDTITLTINRGRRSALEAHHTATHLLHWAIHELVSQDATQQGSSVSRDRLTFDFNSKALTVEQLSALEEKVNASIQSADTVSWIEVPHADVKDRADIMQFFGDKYGDLVRVVQIGGGDKTLDGYSMELCGGTHVRNTSEIGLFKIKSEGSTGSGIRRIEALCGPAAESYLAEQQEKEASEKTESLAKLEKANQALSKLEADIFKVADSASASEVKAQAIEAEKALKKAQSAGAARMADSLIADQNITGNILISSEGSPALLQELMNGLKKIHFTQAAFLIVDDGQKLHLGALCGKDGNDNGHGAGNLIKDLGPIVGGRGGGKPDMARGAAPERDKADDLLAAAKAALGL